MSRQSELHDHKREAILAAARAVFAEGGLAGTTIRAIAARAGYTPGAIYFYYPGREAILADLMARSLGEAARAVKAAGDVAGAARALYRHYATRPAEARLLFQLLPEAAPTPVAGRQIMGRLIALLTPFRDLGLADADAVSLLAQTRGLLLLDARLNTLGQSGAALLDRHVEHLLQNGFRE